MKERYILAIDQGTTGTRAVMYDRKGMHVASAYEELHQYYPKPGWVEQSPTEIWETVENTIHVDAYFSATKLEWLLQNVPDAFRKAKDGALVFGRPIRGYSGN